MRVTSTKPKKYATVEHYALHRATVTVRNATTRELDACAEVAKRHPWATRSAYDPCVWEVRQPYEGRPANLGGADHDMVSLATEELSDEMRRA
jgi:hypothetical protein